MNNEFGARIRSLLPSFVWSFIFMNPFFSSETLFTKEFSKKGFNSRSWYAKERLSERTEIGVLNKGLNTLIRCYLHGNASYGKGLSSKNDFAEQGSAKPRPQSGQGDRAGLCADLSARTRFYGVSPLAWRSGINCFGCCCSYFQS